MDNQNGEVKFFCPYCGRDLSKMAYKTFCIQCGQNVEPAWIRTKSAQQAERENNRARNPLNQVKKPLKLNSSQKMKRKFKKPPSDSRLALDNVPDEKFPIIFNEHQYEIISLKFQDFPSFPKILSGNAGQEIICHIPNSNQVVMRKWIYSKGINLVKFADWQTIATSSSTIKEKNQVNFIMYENNRESLKKTLVSNQSAILSYFINSSNTRIYLGGYDGFIEIWDVEKGEKIRELKAHDKPIDSILVDTRNNIILTGSRDTTVKVWERHTMEQISTLIGHDGLVSCFSISLDGRILASGSADKQVIIWDLDKKKAMIEINGHKDEISCLSFMKDDQYLASGSWDGTIKIWDVSDGKLLHTFYHHHREPVSALAISDDDHYLASGGRDNKILLWRVNINE